MKLAILLLIAGACGAQQQPQPWVNTRFGYLLCGFTSDAANTDTFACANTLDGRRLTRAPGSWSGLINAPAALQVNGAYYWQVATANNQNGIATTWKWGTSDATTGVVTTTITVDWAGKSVFGGALFSVYAGTFYVEGGNGDICSSQPTKCHMFMPATKTDINHFLIYETHPTMWPPTSAADFSDPVLVTTDETNVYDPAVYLITPSASGPCYMVFTHGADATHFYVSLAQSNSQPSCLGPYVTIKGDGALFPASYEGGVLLKLGPASWRLFAENIGPQIASGGVGQYDPMQFIDCNALDVSVCSWSAVQNVIEDAWYRHFTVIPLLAVPGSALSRSSLGKGAIQ